MGLKAHLADKFKFKCLSDERVFVMGWSSADEKELRELLEWKKKKMQEQLYKNAERNELARQARGGEDEDEDRQASIGQNNTSYEDGFGNGYDNGLSDGFDRGYARGFRAGALQASECSEPLESSMGSEGGHSCISVIASRSGARSRPY